MKPGFLLRSIILVNFLLLHSSNILSQSKTVERLELKRLELENKYRSVGQFDSITGIATVYDNMKMGFIDTLGKIIFPIGEYTTRPFYDGFGICEKNGVVSAVNKYGQVIKEFSDLLSHSAFKKGVALITEKKSGHGKYGIIDSKGNKLIDCKYEYIEKISENYYYVSNNRTGTGIISSSGDTILPLKNIIDYFDTTHLHFIGYNKDTGYGIFSKKGETIKYLGKSVFTNSSYVEGYPYFQRDSLIIFKDRFSGDSVNYAILNLNLDTVVPSGKYYHISEINEGLIKFSTAVTTDEYGRRTNPYQYINCGFLDLKGNVVIAPQFDFALYFTEGMSAVRVEDKWGFIDRSGEMVIPLKFDHVLCFRNGFAKVQIKDKFFIIDKSGNIVLNSRSY